MALDQTLISSTKIVIQADKPKAISPNLFGIFFEDINYAADGGLYAEHIQNRSFEYSSADHPDWNFFTGWELIPNGSKASIALGSEAPLHPNNPRYLMLTTDSADATVGLRNGGFDGIVLKANETYNVSLFARVLTGSVSKFSVRLENRIGEVLGEAALPNPTAEWTK